jgi:hypothetical protein
LAPQNLRIPLLGYRTLDGRLTFPLCAHCADRKLQSACRHDESQRSWKTGYTHEELNKSLELGYKVLNVYEVGHFTFYHQEKIFRFGTMRNGMTNFSAHTSTHLWH